MNLHEKFPQLINQPHISDWLSMQVNLTLADSSIEAYARALIDYVDFCGTLSIDLNNASRQHIAQYVRDLAVRPVIKSVTKCQEGYANATMKQRITALRGYYTYLKEEKLRDDNPVRTGVYTKNKSFGGNRCGLLPHYEKLPWIPTEEQWISILEAARNEPIRNRLMLAMSYDAGLRREEICSLSTGDIDPSHRLLSLRAEVTKSRRGRVVPYSVHTGKLYVDYLHHRRQINRTHESLFLSESRRNRGQQITISTWSKAVRELALRAGVPQFTPHTLRHLCFTDLARAGWDIHEIATFAGHRDINTTMIYIHLSGRELAAKVARSMNSIHAWRIQEMQKRLL
ncbi:MAG: site-specific integrase [Hymenobacter sp.]|nr:MAG: site-specific integrase [Hymenobacter sp.]